MAAPQRSRRKRGHKGTGGERLAGPGTRPTQPARPAAARGARPGRRRKRLLLGLAIVVIAAAAAGVVAVTLFARHGSGPAHSLTIPSKLGSFVRAPQLEQEMGASQLQQQVIAKSGGQASHVVSAVYQNSAGAPGSASPQILLFVGGKLSGVSPTGFITGFTAQFTGAHPAAAGPMGGSASCVSAQGSQAGAVALCIWADNDTFGVVASPTMDLAQLSAQLRAIRPQVEHTTR
jgi:hypothetical protein